MSVAQKIKLLTHALSGITIIFIPDTEPKFRTVRLNIRHVIRTFTLWKTW